ncbi:cyclic-di-AMP-binding protein CbpB [Vagococcus entomophilus]|uniref:CBS domain-containing protein n=1 Tax=Vagococcus entomophilus TaxID=1160095 RepID=A0A430AJ04_9ENTE|nr:cyclic-di-AMP-binding protein CbpB [Vagococcus entomophilus]RSU07964.1 CBS domain-containing protein [Vagococcus entomophilus]
MIGNAIKSLLLENKEHFLISSDNVATVMAENPLSHALLVLSKVGYSVIPVVNKKDQIVGLLSLSAIVDEMFELTTIDTKKLDTLKVKDVMDAKVPVLKAPYEIERVLHMMVDRSFIPVVDEDEVFLGIVTRRELLKAVNHMAHELELNYELTKKEACEKEKI